VSTTVVSFLPVFTMQAAEGKLFKPLAFTKTFALIASVIVALTIIPPFAQIMFTGKIRSALTRRILHLGLVVLGIVSLIGIAWWLGILLIFLGAYQLLDYRIPGSGKARLPWIINGFVILVVLVLLSSDWQPLGVDKGLIINFLFIGLLISSYLILFQIFKKYYTDMLRWALGHKLLCLTLPSIILVLGLTIWLGFNSLFGWIPRQM
jgi:Cu(I)/Ag(I) efflux system membrane protein CusA/SilA